MVNNELFAAASSEIFESLGFTIEDDGSGDPRGVDWNIKTEKFHLYIDPWCEVMLAQRNPDTDFITLHVPNVNALKSVVEWVKKENGRKWYIATQ